MIAAYSRSALSVPCLVKAIVVDGSVSSQMNSHDLPIADTVVDLLVHDSTGLLHNLGRRAAAALKIDDNIVFNALMKREELGSTGVGNGVAIPHARLEQVNAPFGILARLKEPIDFNAIDG